MSNADTTDRDGNDGGDVPDQYRDEPDAPLTESVGTTVTAGTKAFLEDYVDVHPEYDRVAELLRDYAESVKAEKGQQVAELKNDLDSRREEL